MTGADLIVAERHRQIAEEDWTSAHDDGHTKREMVKAAIRYAAHDLPHSMLRVAANRAWPWATYWYKPRDVITNLARAGALIAAEIDRLQREAATESVMAADPSQQAKGASA